MTDAQALDQLAAAEGMDPEDLVQQHCSEASGPAICKKCGYIMEQVEADAENYQCHKCGENACSSGPILMGVI